MNEPYLLAAYVVFWFVVFAYVLVLGLKFKALNHKLSQLENVLANRD